MSRITFIGGRSMAAAIVEVKCLRVILPYGTPHAAIT